MSAHRSRMRRAAAVGDQSIPDAKASRPPTHRPTGVASTNPAFGCSTSTLGVARACNPRKPAATRKAHATSNRRGSDRRPAAPAIRTPSATFRIAVPSTSPKWATWFSHLRSSCGRAIRSHRTSAGSTMWNVHAATRAHAPERVRPLRACTTPTSFWSRLGQEYVLVRGLGTLRSRQPTARRSARAGGGGRPGARRTSLWPPTPRGSR